MGLTKEAYRALESVVGKENISDDPAICQANLPGGSGIGVWDKAALRSACVVLPGSTKEVQEIVAIANRYKLPFAPSSTFMIALAAPNQPNAILIDLKRMNRLDIDDKNMFAICEPGVCSSELQIEVAKRGLWVMVPFCGGQASVLANHAVHGAGPTTYRFGYAYRRILATEWVLPNGELLNLGSTSLLRGYFWGEGPGPDLRGLLRGLTGPFGGLGVVTRMAVKLLPFVSEPLEPSGVSPNTTFNLPTNRMKWYNITYPDAQKAVDGMYEIAKNELGVAVFMVPALFRYMARFRGKGTNEFWEAWSKVGENVDWQDTMIRVLLVGFTSEKQLLYEEQVLKDVVAETSGTAREGRPTDESQFVSADAICAYFVSGVMHPPELSYESVDEALKLARLNAEWKKKYASILAEDHGYGGWWFMTELGHMGYYEFLCFADVEDRDTLSKMDVESTRRDIELGAYPTYQDPSILGPAWFNYHEIVRDIKQLFDPNGVANPPRPLSLPWNAFPDNSVSQE